MRPRQPPRGLPPLPARLRREKDESEVEALLRVLRRAARSGQAEQAQTFYSLRYVARRFQVPVTVVRRVFAQLGNERLLGPIRSSRTLLHGLKYDRGIRIAGIVGLPVPIYRFALFSDERAFLLHLRRQLRRRSIMPAAVFFEQSEARGSFLAERLREARVDTVLWLSPGRECKQAADQLKDWGVRLLGAGDCALSSIECRYQFRRDKALRTILRAWRAKDGIEQTVLLVESRGYSAANEHSYRGIIAEENLGVETLSVEERSMRSAAKWLLQKKRSGVLLTASAAAFSMLREPAAMKALMRKHRVAFIEGRPALIFAAAADLPVDLISLDWEAVADRVADDLAARPAREETESLVFQAEARLRASFVNVGRPL